MLKSAKKYQEKHIFFKKNLVFPKNILILQMSMIFINVMEGKVHGISSFPTVPPLHPFFKKGKETEKGETIK